MSWYRILQGVHSDGDKTYYAGSPDGDVIETDTDLLARNLPGVPPRYKLVEGPDPLKEPDRLEALTVPELRALAEEEEIDLGTAVRKGEIVAVIRQEAVEKVGIQDSED